MNVKAIYHQSFANGILPAAGCSTGIMPNPSYPLIKSPVLRHTVEILAAALLIAFIVLGLVASEAVAMVALGAFLMVLAFAASGIRPGLSPKSPFLPVRRAGRVAMFSVGVLSLVLGIARLLRH